MVRGFLPRCGGSLTVELRIPVGLWTSEWSAWVTVSFWTGAFALLKAWKQFYILCFLHHNYKQINLSLSCFETCLTVPALFPPSPFVAFMVVRKGGCAGLFNCLGSPCWRKIIGLMWLSVSGDLSWGVGCLLRGGTALCSSAVKSFPGQACFLQSLCLLLFTCCKMYFILLFLLKVLNRICSFIPKSSHLSGQEVILRSHNIEKHVVLWVIC